MIITCATVDSDRVPQLCFSSGPSTAGRNVEMVSPEPSPVRSVQFPTTIRAAIIKVVPAVIGKRITSFILLQRSEVWVGEWDQERNIMSDAKFKLTHKIKLAIMSRRGASSKCTLGNLFLSLFSPKIWTEHPPDPQRRPIDHFVIAGTRRRANFLTFHRNHYFLRSHWRSKESLERKLSQRRDQFFDHAVKHRFGSCLSDPFHKVSALSCEIMKKS